MTGHRVRRTFLPVLAALALIGLLPGCKVPGQQPGGGYTMTAYFTKAVSLYPKSSVRVLGLSAGTVTSVKTQGSRVEVKMSMSKPIVLPQGVKATIIPQSLLGERYVQLYPAWVEGQPKLNTRDPSQTVLGLDRTSIPVEPDEALAALKRLLDDLDPSATGRLINNLSQDLTGNGQNLNDALRGLGTVTQTLGDKDKQIGNLIDNFDKFTTTLDTRETQLGTVMDLFAQTTSLLSAERGTIATLLHNLADTAGNALDLVSKHGAALETDVNTLTRLLQSLNANLDAVSKVMSSAPILVAGNNLDSKSGIIAAYNPTYHRIDLRTQLTPLMQQFLQALGLPVCASVPGSGTQSNCPPGPVPTTAPSSGQAPSAATAGAPAAAAPGNPLTVPTTPTTLLPCSATTTSSTTSTTAPTPTIPCIPTPPTTLPPVTLPPIKGPVAPPVPGPSLPDVAVNPLSPVMALLGSPGATGPIEQSAYGLSSPPAPAPRQGALAGVARWCHTVLENLW